MNENAYRVRAERGQVQIGTWVTLIRTPAVLTLLKAAGLDFARVDLEHSPFSIETVADMAALARALDFPLVVRPPEGNREWITRLDEIAAVPGIDALTIGPTDLAQDLGVLGAPTQRQVLDEHRRRLVAAARKHGKAVAMLTDSVEGVRQMIALGATILNYSSDAAVLRSGYASVVDEIRRTPSARA